MSHHTPTFNELIFFHLPFLFSTFASQKPLENLRFRCFLPGAVGAKFEPVARSTYMATRVEALKSSNIRLILEETEELRI